MNPARFTELISDLPDDLIESAAEPRGRFFRWQHISALAACAVLAVAAAVYPRLKSDPPPRTDLAQTTLSQAETTETSAETTTAFTETVPTTAHSAVMTTETHTTVPDRTDTATASQTTETASAAATSVTQKTEQSTATDTTVSTQKTASTTSTSTTASTNQAETSDFQDQTTVEPHLYTSEDVTGTGISILRAEEIPVTVLQWNAAPPAAGAGDQIFCELYQNRKLPAAVLNENQALLASDLYRSYNFVLITLETYAVDAVYSDGYLTVDGILHFEVGVSPDTNTLGRQTIRFAVMVPKTLFLPFSQYTAEAIAVSAANAAAFAAMKEAADDPNHPKFTHYYYE